jgi:hypothetical protein
LQLLDARRDIHTEKFLALGERTIADDLQLPVGSKRDLLELLPAHERAIPDALHRRGEHNFHEVVVVRNPGRFHLLDDPLPPRDRGAPRDLQLLKARLCTAPSSSSAMAA